MALSNQLNLFNAVNKNQDLKHIGQADPNFLKQQLLNTRLSDDKNKRGGAVIHTDHDGNVFIEGMVYGDQRSKGQIHHQRNLMERKWKIQARLLKKLDKKE